MKRFSVELKIIILLLFAIAAVLSAGYLAYNSINFILSAIKKEAQPNYSIIVLKEINNSLQIGESNIGYFNLTGNDKYLIPYYDVISSVDEKIDLLNTYNHGNKIREAQIDTISILLEQKFTIWKQMLTQDSDNRVNSVLSKLSNALDSVSDTVTFQVPRSVKVPQSDTLYFQDNNQDKVQKSNIFARIFKKKPEEVPVDSAKITDQRLIEEELKAIDTSIALGIDKNLLQYEIIRLQDQEGEDLRRLTASELSLHRKNVQISFKLNNILSKIEIEELEFMKKRAQEADNLVALTNKWSITFLVMFLTLLFSVLYIIQRYIRKSHRTQLALIQAKDAALNLSSTKEQFLANMSHEIRTPMNAILGFTEQILQMPLNKEPKEQLEIIKDSADHLLRIINDILDFSKLDAGKLALDKTAFVVEDLLEQAFQLYKPSADLKKIKFTYNYAPDSARILIGDKFRIRQIIYNLISNAIKFTSEGEVILNAETKILSEDLVNLIIEVKDSGIGIPQEKLRTIFEEFTQAETSTTRNYGGTGLGLAIVKKLIHLHEGTISVTNNVDKGVCFTTSINIQIGEEKDILPNKINLKKSQALLSKYTILVADDDSYNRKLIQHILEKRHANYTIVNNGEETIKQLNVSSFDLVLLDIHMPKLNGYEVARTIRKKEFGKNSHTPIIALTASTSEETQKKCKDVGIDAIIAKPYTENELMNSVIDILKIQDSETLIVPEIDSQGINELSEKSESTEFRELYKLANNDKAFVQEMLSMFITSTEKDLFGMQVAYDEQDWLNFAELTHKIISPCRHLDSNNLSAKLKELELMVRNNAPKEQVFEAYNNVKSSVDRLISKVSIHLKNNYA